MSSVHFSCITIVLLTIFFNSASAITCYNCSSHEDTECINVALSDNSSLIECTQPEAFCRKTIQTLIDSGLTIITRACGWERFEKYTGDYCMTSNTNFMKEKSCQCFHDGCNAANSLKAMSVLTLLISIVTVWNGFIY